MDQIKLKIYTPDGIVCDEMVSSITLPGSLGRFTILNNHSPIISSIDKGKIKYISNDETTEIESSEGFVEGKDNNVTIYIEWIAK